MIVWYAEKYSDISFCTELTPVCTSQQHTFCQNKRKLPVVSTERKSHLSKLHFKIKIHSYSITEFKLWACSHDPWTTHCPLGQPIAPGQLTDPWGQLCLGTRSDACNYSHELFGATSRGGLPVAEVSFLHANRTQKLPKGKCNLTHAHY